MLASLPGRLPVRSFPTARVFSAAFAVLLACGCGGKNRVTGQVTLDGEPVTDGIVTFIDAANRQKIAPIFPDGHYCLDDPPAGAVQVTVHNPAAHLRAAVGRPPVRQDVLAKLPPLPAPPAPLPRRYEQPGNGLEFEVTGGSQVFDIELTSDDPANGPSRPRSR